MSDPLRVHLVVARGAAPQQQALDRWLSQTRPDTPRAAIVESAFTPLTIPADVPLERLAPGCVCCVGQVPLRVALTRLVRAQRPREVLMLLANDAHLPKLRAQLTRGELGVPVQVVDDVAG